MNEAKFLPGPMEGVMQSPLLRAWLEMDAFEALMTPFLRITTGVPRVKILERYVTGHIFPAERLIVQLMGIDPVLLAEAAAKFHQLGVRGINFNFGCPSRQVISGGAGGGALKNPALMRETLERTREKIPEATISIKLRSGFHSSTEMDDFLPPLLERNLVDYLIMHFRSVEEQYANVDGAEERFRRAVKLAGAVPVYVNGSIDNADAACRILTDSGAYGVMSARGLLLDPLLGRRIEGVKDLPPPEAARTTLWRKILSAPSERSWLVELAMLSLGAAHPVTGELKSLKEKKVSIKNLKNALI